MAARIEQIAAAAEQITASAHEHAESIGEVAAVAEESSASTEQVSASTEETSASAEQIAASAHELASNAEALNQLVGHFQISDDGGSSSADALEAARDAHKAWGLACARRSRPAQSATTVEQAAADDQCAFGKWLHSPGEFRARHPDRWQEIHDLHEQFHRNAAHVLKLAITGQQRQAEELVQGPRVRQRPAPAIGRAANRDCSRLSRPTSALRSSRPSARARQTAARAAVSECVMYLLTRGLAELSAYELPSRAATDGNSNVTSLWEHSTPSPHRRRRRRSGRVGIASDLERLYGSGFALSARCAR